MGEATEDVGALNLRWSQALVDGLAAAGVSDAVISPGSRSTPLALAFLRRPEIRTHVVIDERSAAFFALGIAKVQRRPAALLCTSGSAPANWFPAIIEADEGATPLLLLSADRPPEMRGWGANQTIDQIKLFGDHVRTAHALGTPDPDFDAGYLHRLAARAVAESLTPIAGPVHLNLPFREPLVPPGDLPAVQALPRPVRVAGAMRQPDPEAITALAKILSGGEGVIVAGGPDYPAGFADAVAALAARLDAPVIAEPLSNLRFGPHDRSRMLVRAEAFLRQPSFSTAHRPRWVLRFGAFPVSRSVQNWLAAAKDRPLIVVDPAGRWPDPLFAGTQFVQADPGAVCSALAEMPLRPSANGWRAAFVAAELRAERLAAGPEPPADVFEGALIPALIDALPSSHRLLLGNSMAIRDFDTFSGSLPKPLLCFGNRGASGIDGNVSSAAGIAAAGGPTVALLGDLACVHDLGGFALAKGQDLVVVAINNGGGGIFSYLPQAALGDFERAWLTPPDVDLGLAASAWGIAHCRVNAVPEFSAALRAALARGGPHLLEVVVDRQVSVAGHRDYWAALARD
ncbi:MAG: 2-succinyl-5-enolpyruvyl-6-hydroxy-3-cyclohexene-1-carboxylic-acid synthase [Rhodocyclaceae bacterium]